MFVNNLTQTLKNGFNLDGEISDHFNSILQSQSVTLKVANDPLDLMGVLFSASHLGTFIYINATVTNSISEWSLRENKGKLKSELTQVQDYFATRNGDYLDIEITSQTLMVNTIELHRRESPVSISIKHDQVFRYQYCVPSNYYNFIFAVVLLTMLALLKYMIPKNLFQTKPMLDLKIFDEATLKMKAEE
ncbi:hypothetical protein BC833DRAFT_625070 [Globomyces pollinis-pini]|nr:hypothetical protein BC833DRAFT_625070 [Globomyces pollinis-pini]